MGCDVHMFLEKYTDEEDQYLETLAEDLEYYEYYDDSDYGRKIKNLINSAIKSENRDSRLNTVLEEKSDKRWIVIDQPYGDRNYELFSKLADVRSYGEYNAIAEPQGIPDDASLYYQIKTDQWDSNGHSHSYFYLSDLLKHDFSEISTNFSNFVESYREKEDIDNYRIVFFFDN